MTRRPTIGAYQRMMADAGIDVRARVLRDLATEMIRQSGRRAILDRIISLHETVRCGRRFDVVGRELRALADEVDRWHEVVTERGALERAA